MYICDMCKEPIVPGTQYVNAFDKNICLDCAVRNTLDDVMAVFGITYTEAPDEIVTEGVIVYNNTDSVATPEQVENFFHSENTAFSPTQVGEKMEKNAEYGMVVLNPTQVGEKNKETIPLPVYTDEDKKNWETAYVDQYEHVHYKAGNGGTFTIDNDGHKMYDDMDGEPCCWDENGFPHYFM